MAYVPGTITEAEEKAMKLCCPICQSKYSMADLVHEATKNEMIELASKFGKNWALVFEYTECFRTSQWGSVREQKRLRLLKEIWRLFERNDFEIDGKRYRTDWGKILGAIRVTVDADKFGFKNHNYLKRVLLGEGGDRLSAEGMTAEEEEKREIRRRQGDRAGNGPGAVNEDKIITAAEAAKNKGLTKLSDIFKKKSFAEGAEENA